MGSIEPGSAARGCAACYPQPVDEAAVRGAMHLVDMVYDVNCRRSSSPLPDIVYRSSDNEYDILHHVFRWDRTHYRHIFQEGFVARRQENTSDETYFNLLQHVNSGRPLDTERTSNHAFISTSRTSAWRPYLHLPPNTPIYRYEIYAPGGILVRETLRDYNFPGQDEICFVGRIAPQYIRSVQIFRRRSDARGRYRRMQRVDNFVRINMNFNPQSHPPRLLRVHRPACGYRPDGRTWEPLTIRICRYGADAGAHRLKRQVSSGDVDSAMMDLDLESVHSPIMDWYARDVADVDSYIDAAFRSSRTDEAYLFMKNEYVRLNYAPGTTDDRVVNGPLLICDGFPSLRGTAFGEDGIDCAFRSVTAPEEAFIFSGNLCAVIIYAPGTTDDRVKEGPMTIAEMFPFFKGTVFESGVDAAFESTVEPEAYLFKGNQYARISYGPPGSRRLITQRPINQGFYSLRGTIFESGIDAAFASHRHQEAYVFKGDSYALINFAPGTTDDYMIGGGVKKILPNWPSLRGILPRKNRGTLIDDHVPSGSPDQAHVHDEL